MIAQQAAQRRQKQAEDLVNFMLGDLSVKLRQVDRLDILSTVDDKAMAYFKSLPATDVNATELAQRAKALQRIGEVRMDRSKLSDAMAAFQQALRLNKQLVDAAPNDAMRQNAYAENLLWVGFADWKEGKLDFAEGAFTQSAAALERAVALAPSDNDVAQNLDAVYADLGHVAQARGELDIAEREFTKDQALCQRMATSHSGDVDWDDALGHADDNLATVALMRGHLDSAIQGYLVEHGELAAAVTHHPQDVQIQDDLIRSDAILGRTLALAGQTPKGTAYVESALKLGEQRLKFDPSHDGWRAHYSYYSALLGTLRMEQGDMRAAGAPIADSIATLQALVTKDHGNDEWMEDLVDAQLAGARFALALRQDTKAEQLAEVALKSLRKPLADNPSSTHSLRDEATAQLILGQLGNSEAAAKHDQDALALMRRISTHSSDPRTLAVLTEALLVSGNGSDANSYILELQKMGYRPIGFVALLQQHGIHYPENTQFNARVAKILRSNAVDPSTARPGMTVVEKSVSSHRGRKP
ncbi:MAG: hypothetical protein ACREP2_15100 [Rhodanobacteraceae bacterium]